MLHFSADFNPRSPCGERLGKLFGGIRGVKFQSALPLRGATLSKSARAAADTFQSALPLRGATLRAWWTMGKRDFNPRSPCGERPISRWATPPCTTNFNPRSPCGERRISLSASSDRVGFQSALPLRGATQQFCEYTICTVISIRAPLAGSDASRKEERNR